MKPPDPSDLLFSKKCFEERRGELRLHMSHFFLRYLNDLYQEFGGDLALAIILGEIAHHNTTHFFSPERVFNEDLRAIQSDSASWAGMEGCNAYSLSCATGIPRETVRRKIAELKKRGWIEEVPKQGLCFTKACANFFGEDYSLRCLNGLLRASRKIEALLAEEEMRTNGSIPPHSSMPKPGGTDTLPQPKVQNKTRKTK